MIQVTVYQNPERRISSVSQHRDMPVMLSTGEDIVCAAASVLTDQHGERYGAVYRMTSFLSPVRRTDRSAGFRRLTDQPVSERQSFLFKIDGSWI